MGVLNLADFKDIIKQLRLDHNYGQLELAQALNVSKSTIAMWETGKRYPSKSIYEKLANFFSVNMDYLYGRSEFKTKEEMLQHFDNVCDIPALQSDVFRLEKGMKIPVLGDVAAGAPIFAEENYIGSEEISEELASTGEFFALRIHGDSMSPRISEGDIVIIRQQDDADSGDIVIVLIDDDSATCKRLMKYQEGISLISFNPAYKPMTFSNKDIEEKPIRIIGKVVENRQKY